MKKVYEFDAILARSLAEQAKSITGEYLRQQTIDLLEYIKSDAERGSCTMCVTESRYMDSVILARLRDLGFDVKEHSNQRDGDSVTISW